MCRANWQVAICVVCQRFPFKSTWQQLMLVSKQHQSHATCEVSLLASAAMTECWRQTDGVSGTVNWEWCNLFLMTIIAPHSVGNGKVSARGNGKCQMSARLLSAPCDDPTKPKHQNCPSTQKHPVPSSHFFTARCIVGTRNVDMWYIVLFCFLSLDEAWFVMSHLKPSPAVSSNDPLNTWWLPIHDDKPYFVYHVSNMCTV